VLLVRPRSRGLEVVQELRELLILASPLAGKPTTTVFGTDLCHLFVPRFISRTWRCFVLVFCFGDFGLRGAEPKRNRAGIGWGRSENRSRVGSQPDRSRPMWITILGRRACREDLTNPLLVTFESSPFDDHD